MKPSLFKWLLGSVFLSIVALIAIPVLVNNAVSSDLASLLARLAGHGYTAFADPSGHLVPATNATYDLGESSTPLKWRDAWLSRDANIGRDSLVTGDVSSGDDLLLTSVGAVINFNSGDVTITHAANTLSWAGASSGYFFDAAPQPTTNDAAALGAATVSWADLFLASGGTINWANGDTVLTQSAGLLKLTAGNWAVSRSAAGSTVTGQIENTDATNAASHASQEVKVTHTSADPAFLLSTAATTVYYGLDNSDSDAIFWGLGTAVGTTPLLRMAADGTTFAFQQATTITTAATTLTLAPSTDVLVSDGHGLVVGHTAQLTAATIIPEFQVLGTDYADGSFLAAVYSTTANRAPLFNLGHGRSGTIGTNSTAMSSGDALGFLQFLGSDATALSVAAVIDAYADAAWTSGTDRPTRLGFWTTPDGSGTVTERLRITNAGVITTLVAAPANVTALGAGIFRGGLAFTDVANAWIDDASNGSGTVTHYIGNNTIDVTASSRQWKENILPVGAAAKKDLDIFAGLLREYDYKNGDGHFVGMIAEEVREVLPQYVVGSDDAPSLRYPYMVGPLIWGWQDHETRIEALEKELAALTAGK